MWGLLNNIDGIDVNGWKAIWQYGCIAVGTYYIIIIIMRVGRSTEDATDDVIGPSRKQTLTPHGSVGRWIRASSRSPRCAIYCSSDFVDIDRTDLEQRIYQTASSRPATPSLHLDTCVLVLIVPLPSFPSRLVQFPSLNPTPSSTTLHHDPHDPRPSFTLSRLPTAPQRSTINRATVPRRQLRWRVTINPQDSV